MPNHNSITLGRDIYSTNFADYLPDALKRDPKMKALAAAVTEQMLRVSKSIDNVLIYSRINELPEELVDILAFDMHVDWYDYSYPLEVKRDILKNSVKVHKKMGTKYAVKTALSSLYPDNKIMEWFEYGGKPYTFRIQINVTDTYEPIENKNRLIKTIDMYKRLTAHLEVLIYYIIVIFIITIRYENRLTMMSSFYPRYNIPVLFLDGEGFLNGEYTLNGYYETQDTSPLLLNGESELNGRYSLDGFRDIQLFDFYPANLLINGYFRQEVNSFGDLSLPIQISLSVNDNFDMKMCSSFYPRYNVPLFRLDGTQFLDGTHSLNEMDQDFESLFLDGEGFLDGGYIVNGYRDSNNFDFYPLKMQIKGDCRQKGVVSGFFQSQFHAPLLTERNLCYSVSGKVEENLHTKENLHFLGSAREMVASKEERLTIEKDLWFLDGNQCFDGEVFLDADIYEMEL